MLRWLCLSFIGALNDEINCACKACYVFLEDKFSIQNDLDKVRKGLKDQIQIQ